MTKVSELTPAEIRKAGWEALRSKLGTAGTLRFLLEYDRGEGNYTELRKNLFKDKTVRNIIQDMKKDHVI